MKLAFQLFLMRLMKVCTQTHLYVWAILSEWGLRDYAGRRLLCVIIKSFVLKTCIFLLVCGSMRWVFDFHFVLASGWGLTRRSEAGVIAVLWCRTDVQDPAQTPSPSASWFLCILTNSGNWRTNAQVHLAAIFLLPSALTKTAMGKKCNCSKMLCLLHTINPVL